jgi:hypothetical protein
LHLVLAIGARCHSTDQTIDSCEATHFALAQAQLSHHQLEDVGLHTVNIYLLMAFYMLCASRRNMAYMYLGVAARAAYVVGLHHEETLSRTGVGNQAR